MIAVLPGVSEAVQNARTAVDRLYGHRVLRRRGPEVSAESALRGARASSALEGADVSLESLRSGEADSALVQGALRVSAEIGRLAKTWRTAPRQVLARLHALAAADLHRASAHEHDGAPAHDHAPAHDQDHDRVPAHGHSHDRVPAQDLLGRPRSGPISADPLGLGPAPGAEAAAARMASLVTLVTTPSKAPALVLAAIVHAELVVVRPFGTADGLVARAAERLTLVEFGLDPKSLVAVEVGHADLGEAYAESLRGYLKGTGEGVAGWVRHCAAAVELGARESTAVCEALQRG